MKNNFFSTLLFATGITTCLSYATTDLNDQTARSSLQTTTIDSLTTATKVKDKYPITVETRDSAISLITFYSDKHVELTQKLTDTKEKAQKIIMGLSAEKEALIKTQIPALQKQIEDLTAERDDLNSTRIPALQKQIEDLTAERDDLNSTRIPALQKQIDDLTAEKDKLNNITIPALQKQIDDFSAPTPLLTSGTASASPDLVLEVFGKIFETTAKLNKTQRMSVISDLLKTSEADSLIAAGKVIAENLESSLPAVTKPTESEIASVLTYRLMNTGELDAQDMAYNFDGTNPAEFIEKVKSSFYARLIPTEDSDA